MSTTQYGAALIWKTQLMCMVFFSFFQLITLQFSLCALPNDECILLLLLLLVCTASPLPLSLFPNIKNKPILPLFLFLFPFVFPSFPLSLPRAF